MSDTPGPRAGGARARAAVCLPSARPTTSLPVERFTSPPSIRRLEFSPERAAQVVRQSANARWVGFLAIVVIILFVRCTGSTSSAHRPG